MTDILHLQMGLVMEELNQVLIATNSWLDLKLGYEFVKT